MEEIYFPLIKHNFNFEKIVLILILIQIIYIKN